MAIKPMVNTMPPINDGASKCRQLGSGLGLGFAVVVGVVGNGVVGVVGVVDGVVDEVVVGG